MAPVVQVIVAAIITAFTKKNLKSKTSVLGAYPLAAVTAQSVATSGVLPPDNLEAAITQIVGGLLAVALFFIQQKGDVCKK